VLCAPNTHVLRLVNMVNGVELDGIRLGRTAKADGPMLEEVKSGPSFVLDGEVAQFSSESLLRGANREAKATLNGFLTRLLVPFQIHPAALASPLIPAVLGLDHIPCFPFSLILINATVRSPPHGPCPLLGSIGDWRLSHTGMWPLAKTWNYIMHEECTCLGRFVRDRGNTVWSSTGCWVEILVRSLTRTGYP
jgi:hypothetical protein